MRKLIEEYTDIAAEWHPTKNLPLLLEDVSCGSKRNIWWLGKCGHEFQARPQSRTSRGYGCPYCGRKKKVGMLEDTHPQLVAEWHPRNELSPKEVTGGSHVKVLWLGKCGHEWEAFIHNRTSKQANGCPYCSHKMVNEDNSLASCFPKIAAEWHPTKNGELLPSQVSWKTYKRVWWLGKCGHEWKTLVRVRTRKIRPAGCPICQESRGEVAVERALEGCGVEYETQVRFPECRDKKPLPFDFLVAGSKLLIEYQGLQHYEPVNFGGDYVAAFEGIKRRDEIKRSWCHQNGYELLVIPYWELDNVKEIVEGKV